MRYILQKGYEMCGWKGLPFALRSPDPHFSEFFSREQYEVICSMDGRHDIERDDLTEGQQRVFDILLDREVIRECADDERLEPWQEYKCFPAMYKNNCQWSITGRCNYNCRHCFMSAPDYKGEDLSLKQCIYILDEIHKCGIRCVALTGGEALVNPNFWDIVDEMKKRDIIMDTLYSNGELITEEVLEEFKKREMRPAMHFSFDGVGWHDWLRGIDGAEESVIRAFRLCREHGFQTSSSMCLHKHNIGSLRDTVNLLAELGAVHLKMNVAAPEGRWADEKEHFITQDEAFNAIIDYLPQYVEDKMPLSVQFCGFIDFNKKGKYITFPSQKFSGEENAGKEYACGAVRSGMYISPTGMVLPCMTLGGTPVEKLFDNILEKPLSEILTDSWYRKMSLLKMGECIQHNEKCRDCKFALECGAGCRACACAGGKTDYLGIDKDCCDFFMKGWYKKAKELHDKYMPYMESL